MNLEITRPRRLREECKRLWDDSRVWWINCMGIESSWPVHGQELTVARRRRDVVLAELVRDL